MSELQPGNEWETPLPGSAPDVQRRAAVFVWVTAAAEVLFFGCCASGLAMLRMMPLGRLQAMAAQQPQQISPEQLAMSYGMIWPVVAVLLITGFLPGLAYALLGFGVRTGRRVPIYFTLLLCTTQIIVFGTMLLLGVIEAISSGNAQGMTVSVLMIGSLLLLLGFTVFWLFRAKAFPAQYDGQYDQPWNPPEPPEPPQPPPPDSP